MEMLIVVAIIAVLVAIAIPTFLGSAHKARAAACIANMRALKAKLSTEYMLEEKDFAENTELSPTAEETETYKCPSGGKITYVFLEGNFTVKCSVHGSSNAEHPISESIGTVLDIFAAAGKNTIDSSSDSTTLASVKAELKKQNIDLDALGAKSWSYTKNGGKTFFFWTDVDISTMNVGDKVPVIRYNPVSGTYTVWYSEIKSVTNEGKTYNAINGSVNTMYSGCSGLSASEQTLEKAEVWLKEAQSGKK